MTRRVGRLLASAGVVAVLAGVVNGLVRGSVMAGVVHGVIWGAGAALIDLFVKDYRTATDELSFRQRREITRRLRRGQPVDDPHLAPALRAEADYLLNSPVMPKGGLITAGVFVAFGVAASGLAFTELGPKGLMVGIPLFVIALVFVMTRYLNGHRRDLIKQSLRLTEQRFGAAA